MKIIYLFTSSALNGSSVQTKVINQIKYLNKVGADCKGAFFNTEVNEITPLNEFIDFIPVENCKWRNFRASGQKRKIIQSVLDFTKKNYKNTDFFYFRYPGAGSLLNKFTSKYGNKIIYEHLCIEEFELILQSKENPIAIKPSKLLSWLEYSALPLWRENLFGKSIRKHTKLGICNSQEIADFQNKKSGGNYRCIIGGDAVEVNAFSLSVKPALENELKMIFLKGASSTADFNGLDRLIKSIAQFKGNKVIKLYIKQNITNQ